VAVASFGIIFTEPAPASSSFSYRLSNAMLAALVFGLIAYVISSAVNVIRAIGARLEGLMQRRNDPVKSANRSSSHVVTADYVVEARLSDLHPWVRDAAKDSWLTGSYRHSVEQAAKSINAETQTKLRRRDLSDLGLINESFSEKPPEHGKPRLRFPGDRETSTWANRMRGARAFAEGCFAGIRNVAAHERDVDWTRQVAFEYLCAFSILARWIDECEVYRTD
jgi:hypothetical protein